jgi:uncharacterized protein with von Willebrand factor type A (vWA) domain
MEVTLGRFIAALRHADLRVSPAETLDALAVVNHIGIHNPRLLRDALALTLAKSVEEKRHFSECYERFFNQLAFRTPAKQSFFKSLDAAEMLAHLQPHVSPELLAVVEGTIDNRRDGLAHRMELAAREVGLEEISSLREKSSYAGRLAAALGAKELEALLFGSARVRREPISAARRRLRPSRHSRSRHQG